MSYVIPSAFYFAFFGAMSFLMPFLALFYQQAGYSGTQIGILTGIAPLITLVGAPFWTGLADSKRQHKTILTFSILGVMTAVLLMPQANGFFALFGLVVAYAFLGAPIVSLADSATMSMLGDKKSRYGKIRLWGAVGWGLVALLAGSVIETSGLSWAFYGYALIMSLALLAGLGLHFPREKNVHFQSGMKSLLSSRRWMTFLLMVLLGGIGMATINSYLFVYMESLQISKTLMGLSLTVSTLSEIPIMFFASRFIHRFKPRDVLIIALMAIGARLLLYAFSTEGWQILLTQLIHGLTFPLIWMAGVAFADQVAPPGLSASAQGMFGSTLMGIGAALGGLIGGLLLQQFSPSSMYLYVGLAMFIGAGLFFLQTKTTGTTDPHD